MDELGLGLGVSTPPVFVGHTVGIVVLTVDVVLVDLPVAVVVAVVDRAVVDIVVGDARTFVLCRRTGARNDGARGTEGCTPFELVVAVEVHAVAVLVNLFVEVRQRRHTGERVVSEVLPPSAGGAGFPSRCGAEDLTVVDVAVNVEHGNDVDFTGIHEVGDPLFGVVLVHTEVAWSTGGAVAVGILVFGRQRQTIAVVIELTVAVGIAPCVFVNTAVTVVVVADVFVGEGNNFQLHHRHLVRHPLTGVVVADDHDIVSVSVVSSIAHESVVVATLHVGGDFYPRRRMTVVPAFVGIGRNFFSPRIRAAVHAFVIRKDIGIVLCEPHHASFHRLVGVVLLELKNIITGRRPRENHVDVIFGPHVLGCIARGGFLGVGVFCDRCRKGKQQGKDDEEAQGRAWCGRAKCNGRG